MTALTNYEPWTWPNFPAHYILSHTKKSTSHFNSFLWYFWLWVSLGMLHQVHLKYLNNFVISWLSNYIQKIFFIPILTFEIYFTHWSFRSTMGMSKFKWWKLLKILQLWNELPHKKSTSIPRVNFEIDIGLWRILAWLATNMLDTNKNFVRYRIYNWKSWITRISIFDCASKNLITKFPKKCKTLYLWAFSAKMIFPQNFG